MVRTGLALGPLAAISIILRFVQLSLILAFFGAGQSTDALFAAMVVPQLLTSIVTDSIAQVIIPILSVGDTEKFKGNAWTFLVISATGISILCMLLWISSPLWVGLVAPGFTTASRELTSNLVRIQLMGLVGSTIVSILWCASYSRKLFIRAELAPVMGNAAGLLVFYFTAAAKGIQMAAWVPLISSAVQVMILLPVVGKPKKPNIHSDELVEAGKRIRPLLAGTLYYKMDLVLDRLLSSLAPAGTLSLYYTAQQLYGAGNQVLNRGFIANVIPHLAESADAGQWAAVRQIYRNRFNLVALLGAMGFVATLILGRTPFVALLVRGKVSEEDIALLFQLLALMGGVLVGGGLGQILSSTFYGIGDTKSPTRIGVIGFTIGLALKLVGYLQFGIFGLAAGASLYCLLNVILLRVGLERRLKVLETSG